MITVNLSGLIGKEISVWDDNANISKFGYECVGYGVDTDSDKPTVFLLNKKSGAIVERLLSNVSVVKSKGGRND